MTETHGTTGLVEGDRVYHPKWDSYGTVVRLFPDEPGYPESVGVRFDGTTMSETECAVTELDQIPGHDDDPTPPAGEIFSMP